MWLIYSAYILGALLLFGGVRAMHNSVSSENTRRILLSVVLFAAGVLVIWLAVSFHLMKIEDLKMPDKK